MCGFECPCVRVYPYAHYHRMPDFASVPQNGLDGVETLIRLYALYAGSAPHAAVSMLIDKVCKVHRGTKESVLYGLYARAHHWLELLIPTSTIQPEAMYHLLEYLECASIPRFHIHSTQNNTLVSYTG